MTTKIDAIHIVALCRIRDLVTTFKQALARVEGVAKLLGDEVTGALGAEPAGDGVRDMGFAGVLCW